MTSYSYKDLYDNIESRPRYYVGQNGIIVTTSGTTVYIDGSEVSGTGGGSGSPGEIVAVLSGNYVTEREYKIKHHLFWGG